MKILRLPDVEKTTGLRHSTIYARMANGTFPKSVPLGGNAVGWIESEIVGWIEKCLADRDAQPQRKAG